jgi:elongation factor G
MKEYGREFLRDIGLFSHGGAGKTSLGEALLFTGKATTRLGKVEEGSSLLDSEPEEKHRRSSISVTVAHFDWDRHLINLVDTPGDPNFVTDARNALRAVDAGIFVVDAIDRVKVLTEKLWSEAGELGLARLLFISKMDRERADFEATLEDIRKILGVIPCPLTIPIGAEDKFCGVIDLIKMRALIYETDGSGAFKEDEIPAEHKDTAASYQEKMIEAIAESDDSLLEKYLEGEELEKKELIKALRKGVIAGNIVPLLVGSGTKDIGINPLLDAIVGCVPSPLERAELSATDPKTRKETTCKPAEDGPFCGLIFKTIADPYRGKLSLMRVFSGSQMADSTVYNSSRKLKERIGQILILSGENVEGVNAARLGDIVAVPKLKEAQTGDTFCTEADAVELSALPWPQPVISFAVVPHSQSDEEKLTASLSRLTEEDPTLKLKRDQQTNEFILSGMGQVHIESALERMKRKFGVAVDLKAPKIPYLETFRGKAIGEGKYRKQSGGRGQYGWCWLEIWPLDRGQGFEFEDAIVGGAIPRNYIPSVERGVKEAMDRGILAGYPVTDIHVKLYDGKYHEVDSSDMAFQIAGSLGLKAAAEKAGMMLIEPIMNVEVTAPDECLGDVTGDLNRRRGRLQGMESKGTSQVIKAQAPLAEMLRYAPDLDSITSGRGLFTMEFSHYEEVPSHIAEKIIDKARQERQKEDEK